MAAAILLYKNMFLAKSLIFTCTVGLWAFSERFWAESKLPVLCHEVRRPVQNPLKFLNNSRLLVCVQIDLWTTFRHNFWSWEHITCFPVWVEGSNFKENQSSRNKKKQSPENIWKRHDDDLTGINMATAFQHCRQIEHVLKSFHSECYFLLQNLIPKVDQIMICCQNLGSLFVQLILPDEKIKNNFATLVTGHITPVTPSAIREWPVHWHLLNKWKSFLLFTIEI